MSTPIAFKPRNAATAPRPLSAALLTCSLAIVVAACLVLSAPAAWMAARNAFQAEPSTVAQCEMILGSADRLACFDRLGKEALQPPAKGALAPALFR